MTQYVDPDYWDEDYAVGELPVTLTGSANEQINRSTAGLVRQGHVLGGSVSAQRNTASAGSIGGASVTLSGFNVEQGNTCTSGPIVQVNIVAGFWKQPGAGKSWQPPNPLRP